MLRRVRTQVTLLLLIQANSAGTLARELLPAPALPAELLLPPLCLHRQGTVTCIRACLLHDLLRLKALPVLHFCNRAYKQACMHVLASSLQGVIVNTGQQESELHRRGRYNNSNSLAGPDSNTY